MSGPIMVSQMKISLVKYLADQLFCLLNCIIYRSINLRSMRVCQKRMFPTFVILTLFKLFELSDDYVHAVLKVKCIM